MESSVDNIEVEINEMIDKLILALNDRRKYLLEYLKSKREKLRANYGDEMETLFETRENLNAKKFPNKLQSMYTRMLIELDNKINDYLQPPQEIKFNGNTRDLEKQIATLGEITLHELPILPPVPQQAATPDVCSKSDIEPLAPVLRHEYENHSPHQSPRHVTQDPKQYLWGKMSRGACETLLLQRAKQGEFIFRESVSRAGELVLSMRHQGRVRHFNIKQKNGCFCMGENFRARSLREIISHYQNNPIALSSQGNRPEVFLSQPLEKEEDDIIYDF